jgi:hypothetical protein
MVRCQYLDYYDNATPAFRLPDVTQSHHQMLPEIALIFAEKQTYKTVVVRNEISHFSGNFSPQFVGRFSKLSARYNRNNLFERKARFCDKCHCVFQTR